LGGVTHVGICKDYLSDVIPNRFSGEESACSLLAYGKSRFLVALLLGMTLWLESVVIHYFALTKFTNSRIAPGTPAGNCRKNAYPV
jgi:hypothetical protein